MKIAVCGKGGSGKSTISGALARHLARQGHKVVALDCDPNPNLGISLGVPRESVESMSPILNALLDSGPHPQGPEARGRGAARPLRRRRPRGHPPGGHRQDRAPVERLPVLRVAQHHPPVLRRAAGRRPRRAWPTSKPASTTSSGPSPGPTTWCSPSPRAAPSRSRSPAGPAAWPRSWASSASSASPTARSATSTPSASARSSASRCSPCPRTAAIEDADHLGVAAIDADPTSPAIVAIGELAKLITR